MVTEKLTASPEDIAKAGEILRRGGLVALPTETVYGLAANALDPQAVLKIFAAKGRPADNPLIVHVLTVDQWRDLVKGELPPKALALAEKFWPGPLTVILPKADRVPLETSGGLLTVAVRCPSHPAARAVIEAAGLPLAAPSANLSGRPSPTTFAHTYEELSGRVDAVLDGGDCRVGLESTVISLLGGVPRVLRPGGVTVEELRAVLGEVDVDPAVSGALREGERAASPGMKYKHYAPKAPVQVVDASPEEFVSFVNERREEGAFALCWEEEREGLLVPAVSLGPRYDRKAQARALFSSLLRLDGLGAKTVYAQRPSRAGMGLAVYNRLLRAAGFQVLTPREGFVLGLTGPSGAGKTLIAQELCKQGFLWIDCDRLTRRDDVYDEETLRSLREAFGEEVAPEFRLDRRELARRAFRDEASVKRLGEITFPPIARRVREEIERAGEGAKIVLDAPTLFPSGLDRICRRILAVTAPEELRLRRVMERDGLTEAQARERFQAQEPESFYGDRADLVLENAGGSVKELLAGWEAGL